MARATRTYLLTGVCAIALSARALLAGDALPGEKPMADAPVQFSIGQRPVEVMAAPVADGVFNSANNSQLNLVQLPASGVAEFPRWQIDAEAIVLWRDNSSYRQYLNGFDAGVGPRFTVGFRPSGDWKIEAEYFSALGMSVETELLRVGNPYFYWGSYYTAENYTSELHNVEVNLLRTWDSLSFLAGFRFVRLNEYYSITNGPYYGSSPTLATGTQNDYFGGQLGLQWRENYRRLYWQAVGKGGLFGNDASGSQWRENYDYYYEGDSFATIRKSELAFVGNINFSLGYTLSDVWSVQAGYYAMWLTAAALAPEQSISFNPQELSNGSTVFLQGTNVGFEARW